MNIGGVKKIGEKFQNKKGKKTVKKGKMRK